MSPHRSCARPGSWRLRSARSARPCRDETRRTAAAPQRAQPTSDKGKRAFAVWVTSPHPKLCRVCILATALHCRFCRRPPDILRSVWRLTHFTSTRNTRTLAPRQGDGHSAGPTRHTPPRDRSIVRRHRRPGCGRRYHPSSRVARGARRSATQRQRDTLGPTPGGARPRRAGPLTDVRKP
jgi:hypothetical protein